MTRWGGAYDHMIVLDADSLMAGETLVTLARAMAADPEAGIIQTLPLLINRNTLFARMQQFAGRVYGPVIADGPCRLARARRQLLGPQRHHPHQRLRRSRAACRTAGPQAASAAIS